MTFLLNPLSALIIIVAFFSNRKIEVAPRWHRVGLMITATGLIGQTYRSFVALFYGFQPTDTEMPFWVFKDLGITVLCFYYLFLFCKKKKSY